MQKLTGHINQFEAKFLDNKRVNWFFQGPGFDLARLGFGQIVETAGDLLGLPEGGYSEAIAGGNTINTSRVANAQETIPYSGPGVVPNQEPVRDPSITGGTIGSGYSTGAISQPQPNPGTDYNALWSQQHPGEGDRPAGWFGDTDAGAEAAAREAEARNAINSGYDAYFAQLDDIMNNSLPSQRTAQEGIVGSQFDQGVNSLNTQQAQGVAELDTTRRKADSQQAKTLTDLADNIRNLFQAGNVYLGARGAGDSSAANQYAYALTKMGSKQRGDVTSQYAEIQNDINDREFKLKSTVESELRNLASERDQKIMQISQWFAEQQGALKMAQAQGQLSRGQDLATLSQNLLNTALQHLQTVQTEATNRRSALEQWAMNNATNITQLKQNLAGISQTNYSMPNAKPVAGAPTVDSRGNLFAGGFNTGTDEQQRTNIFGARV